MKRIVFSFLLVAIVALACYVYVVNSAPVLPPGVQVFEVKDHTCVLADGVLQCFCQCDGGCSPTGYATPAGTVTPEATKQKCNSGWGNSTENCNPGNSTQKPHDEGDKKK